jgi:hypothetical protein
MNPPQDSSNAVEEFLRRWSRRKRTANARLNEGSKVEDSENVEGPVADSVPAQTEPSTPVFDPATLPPLDSITAASDIRAFLAPGVPEEIVRAALRRVWVTDPAIRDFVGLAENQWDFTRPDGVPGFGSLEWTSELRDMAAGLFDQTTARSAPQPTPAGPNKQDIEVPEKSTRDLQGQITPTQPEQEPNERLQHRRHKHGGAMPE